MSEQNPLRGSCVSERSRCGAVRISQLADEPSAGIVRVGALSLWRRASFKARRQTLCGDRACRSALAVAPCAFARSPTNPLRGSCVSERSRCGAVRTFYVADEPSAGIVRVGALSLWHRAHLHARRRTLCGDRACRSALAVAPCEFSTSPTHPLRGSCANFLRRRQTLCGDRACRIALAVFARWLTNPVRGARVSDRSRCGAVRICTLADEPSAGIARVGPLPLWFSLKLSTLVVCEARSRTSGLRMASFK